MRVDLNDDDQNFIVNALRVAAEQYDRDAIIASEAGQPRMANQFVYQADRARTLAARLED